MIERIVAACARNRGLTVATVGVLVLWAAYVLKRIPIDAIPDLSDTQVIVYSRWDRSPDIMEDQVTYPITRALLGVPRVKAIRGFSDFGYSYVYVIFEDGSDLYWARSRVLEYLSKMQGQLPEGVKTELGPDGTSVGWIFQYALVDKTGRNSLADLRSLQDWNVRFQVQSVPGVAEVAPVGGFVRQVQVTMDPVRLQAYGVSTMDVVRAVRDANLEMGARLMEFAGTEFMVRGRGYAKSLSDYREAAVRADEKTGTAVRVGDVARVAWGPEIRRGIAELDGEGEAVGGIVIMRHGENAPAVIERVKKRLEDIKPGLPQGVEIETVYDRSDLIGRAIENLKHELVIQMIVVSLVILLFLWHIPSSVIPIVTLPMAVLLAFIPMYYLGVSANIMSLSGIAVAIGAMVDASIVVVENSHKRMEEWDSGGRKGDYRPIMVKAIQEVARPSFYSLLVIAVSFLPVFALVDQEGRLFKPLAFTKNLSMIVAAIMAITLDPAMRLMLIRLDNFVFNPPWLARLVNAVVVGKMQKEEDNPASSFLFKWYHPVVEWVLEHPRRTILYAVLALATTLIPYFRLGSEFMPNLDEGSLLYMPTALPGISVTEAGRILQRQDRLLKSFPQVARVFGKAGRAESSTDIAPFSMVETTILLKPRAEWPEKRRWYSGWMPGFMKPLVRWIWLDRQTTDELVRELDGKMRFPGIPNIWTMPIKNRIDMLSTGIRTPVGIKVMGPDLAVIQSVSLQVEAALRDMPGVRNVFAERAMGGYFLDVEWNRRALARHGISVAEAQMVLGAALGGENVTTMVMGRERYPVNVRYERELRQDIEQVKRVLLTNMMGHQVPLGSVARVRTIEGPGMIRNENGQLAAFVYVDTGVSDIGGLVQSAKLRLAKRFKLPEGYTLLWSGQFENMARVWETLKLVIPLTVVLVFALIYLNTRSMVRTGIILMAVPFSLIGAVWLMWALGYNLSVASAVGMIALAGLDAETGIFMLLYLELAHDRAVEDGRMRTLSDLKDAIVHGAVKRVRPKVMTVACAFIGLLPIMVSTGTGADVMKRIAAPMVGGLFSSFLLELIVYPAVYLLWKKRGMGLATG
ncbi:MAG: efflux RND transporter permease subunit [Candidatus Coatesbacteria bacterium]